MARETIQCAACKKVRPKNPRLKEQTYCGKPECQRERKRLWQKEKLKQDEDYRLNHKDSHRRWLDEHPDYYKQWRDRRPDYVERNRKKQKSRDRRRKERFCKNLAKKDASCLQAAENTGKSGGNGSRCPFLAKMDTFIGGRSERQILAKMDTLNEIMEQIQDVIGAPPPGHEPQAGAILQR